MDPSRRSTRAGRRGTHLRRGDDAPVVRINGGGRRACAVTNGRRTTTGTQRTPNLQAKGKRTRQKGNRQKPMDNGYSIHERVFDRAEMAAAIEALARADMVRTKAGARHVLGVPMVRALAADPRMIRLAAQFVGPAPVQFRATLFDKSPTSNWLVVWHQDTALPMKTRVDDPTWLSWSTKAGVLYAHAPAWALETVVALRLSLDDSTLTNGPLRVLPNTHLKGLLTHDQIQELARQVAPIDCVAAAGGVVAMRPLTVHASSKSIDDRPRRVLHIEYAAAVNLALGIELAVG